MTTESTDKKIKLHPEVQERLDNAHQKKLNELAANPFVQFVTRYKNHPVLFVKEVLNTSSASDLVTVSASPPRRHGRSFGIYFYAIPSRSW